MKKFIACIGLIIQIFAFAAVGLAAEKAVFIESGEGFARAGEAVEENGIWRIPSMLVKNKIYSQSTLDGGDKVLRMVFGKARLQLADKEIEKKFGNRIVMELPLFFRGGASYVELEPAAKIAGFEWTEKADGIYITLNRYTAFSPRVLEKKAAENVDKVVLVWQPTFGAAENIAQNEKKAGLNTVSPSWFAVKDGAGSVANSASLEYVRAAKAKGYRVWPLVTNSFSPDITHAFLNDYKARQSIIQKLAYYMLVYEFDGINVDFENIYDADKNALSSFVAELGAAVRAMGGTTSIDVTIPSGVPQWSACYDRAALAKGADYVMLMAYDEYGRTSPKAGSTATLPWVESGVQKTLLEVPNEKLVLGVPFYMRRWEEDLSGRKTGVKTLTMNEAADEIAAHGIKPVWRDDLGQNYFEYVSGGKKYRVWQEDARSLGLKLELAERYNLAGVAAWRSGFESPDIWQMIGARYEKAQEISEMPKETLKPKKRQKHTRTNSAAVKSVKNNKER